MNRNFVRQFRSAIASCAILLTAPLSGALAATVTWDGDVDGMWALPANWVGDVAPVPGQDSLAFAGAANTATTNNFPAGSQFNGIAFDAGAASFTLGGNGVSLAGNVVNDSANPQVASLPLTLTGLSTTAVHGTNHIVTNLGAGNLTVSGLARTPLSGQAVEFTTAGGAINTPFANNATGIIGAWATIGLDWAANDGGGNIVPYAGYTDVAGAGPFVSDPNANYRWSGGAAMTLPAGTMAMSTLLFTEGTSRTITATGADLVFPDGGGIFKSAATNTQLSIGGSPNQGTVTAGVAGTPSELVVATNNAGPGDAAVNLNSTLIDNGVGGAVTLIKTGFGGLVVTGANTYSGGSYVLEGRLRANTSGTAFGTGPVYVADGAQAYHNAGGMTIANNFFLAGVGPSEGTFDGGAIRLANANNVLSGTITLLADARIGARGAQATTGSGGTVSGQITGDYDLELNVRTDQGAATLVGNMPTITLSNSLNDWGGNTTIGRGRVSISGNGEVIPHGAGKGNMTIFGETGGISMLNLNGQAETINGLFSSGAHALAHVTNNSMDSATLRLGENDASGDFGGNVVDSTGSVSIIKVGAGTQEFGGANNYTGTTTIAAGTLLVNGTHTAAGAYSLGAGATLGGSGTITFGGTAGITADAGSSIAPGESIGTMNLNGSGSTGALLTLASGALLEFELDNAFLADAIGLASGDTADIVFGGNSINFTDLSGGSLAAGAYTLFTSDVPAGAAYSGLTLGGGGVITGGLTIGTGVGGYITSLQLANNGHDIVLNVSAIPEPSALLLMAAGLLGLAAGRRRRACY